MGRGAASRTALLILAVAVLAAGLAIIAGLRDRPHWGMLYEANSARLILVERGAAADAAGMRSGVAVTAIGLLPADPAQTPAVIGGFLPVSVRQGAFTGVYWMAQPAAGIPWTMAVVLYTAAALWLAGVLAVFAGPARRATWLFAGFALAAALALCCAVAQDPPDHAAQWLLAPAVFSALICYLWLQRSLGQDRPTGALIPGRAAPMPPPLGVRSTAMTFRDEAPPSQGGASATRMLRPSLDLILSGQALLVACALLLLPHLLGATTGRPLAIIAALDMPFLLLAAHLPTGGRLSLDAPAPLRRRVRLAALIGLAAWLPALLIGWLPLVAGLLSPGYLPPVSPYLGAASLLAIAVTYPAIVQRGDLFALEIAVRRIAVSLVAGGALLGAALLILRGLDLALHPTPEQRAALAVALALLALPTFDPLRRRVQAIAERRLAGDEIDYSTALEAIGDELLLALGEEAIAGVLTRDAAPLLGITRIQPWLRDASGGWHAAGGAHQDRRSLLLPALTVARGRPPPAIADDGPASAATPDLLDALLRAGQPFAPPAGTAPDGISLCVPVHLGDEVRGMLLLGPRRSQDPYRRRERDALVLLARQVAAALQLVDRIAELRARNAELAQVTSRLARAREEERKHLSRELHDAVAQDLVAITRQLRRRQQGEVPDAIWQDMIAQAQEALTAIRRICNDLRPAILDMGLASALRELIDRLPRPLQVHLVVEGAETRLDEEREFALYRVAQEALANAIKHAEAGEATITVRFEPDATTLEVRDDGRGFAVPARLEEIGGDHLGLLGMRERLAGLGGTVCLESAPGEGTRVRAEIPN